MKPAGQHGFMPPLLEELPPAWREHVYQWEYEAGWGGFPVVRAEIWVPPADPDGQSAIAYFGHASRGLRRLWTWLEQRHVLLALPELVSEGQCEFDPDACVQRYSRVQYRMRFLAGPRRSTASSSPTASSSGSAA